jgi:hypothetical protein
MIATGAIHMNIDVTANLVITSDIVSPKEMLIQRQDEHTP